MDKEMEQTLIKLHNVSLRERKQIIKEIESQCYRVEFRAGAYHVVSPDGQWYTLRKKHCENCRNEQLISEFYGTKNEGPWCKTCRKADPTGAKMARDREVSRARPTEAKTARKDLYKQRHPGRRHRSESSLIKKAHKIAIAAIEGAIRDQDTVMDDFTLPQREIMIEEIKGIIKKIRKGE